MKQVATCCLLHAGFLLGFSSTLKMEAACSSELSIDFQRTTWLYIPEDGTTIHNFVRYINYAILMKFHQANEVRYNIQCIFSGRVCVGGI
jgi:hypothetical protein